MCLCVCMHACMYVYACKYVCRMYVCVCNICMSVWVHACVHENAHGSQKLIQVSFLIVLNFIFETVSHYTWGSSV